MGGPLPESAIGNLGAQPFPHDGWIHCLSFTPVSMAVAHSICLPILTLPFFLPAVSFLTPFLTPLSPTPSPSNPPQLSLQGSQSRSPPPPPPAAPSPIPVPSPSPRPSRGPC